MIRSWSEVAYPAQEFMSFSAMDIYFKWKLSTLLHSDLFLQLHNQIT